MPLEESLKRYLLLKHEIGEPVEMVCTTHIASVSYSVSCPRSFHPRMLSYASLEISIFETNYHHFIYDWIFIKNGRTHGGYFKFDEESFKDYLRLSEAFDI